MISIWFPFTIIFLTILNSDFLLLYFICWDDDFTLDFETSLSINSPLGHVTINAFMKEKILRIVGEYTKRH